MIPNWPLRIFPAIVVMSDMSEATVLGAVEAIAGTDGFFAAVFERFDLAAAARRRAADVVVFFFVLVCDGSGAAASDARRITDSMRSFRYNI